MKTGKAAGPSGKVAEVLKALVILVSFHLIVNVDDEAIFPKGKVMFWREVTTEVSNSLIMS